MAVGWLAAEGGGAVARHFAVGGMAVAMHANDAAARQFLADYPWLDLRRAIFRNTFTIVCWLPLIVVGIFFQLRRRRAGRG
jgi:hypothetical protein